MKKLNVKEVQTNVGKMSTEEKMYMKRSYRGVIPQGFNLNKISVRDNSLFANKTISNNYTAVWLTNILDPEDVESNLWSSSKFYHKYANTIQPVLMAHPDLSLILDFQLLYEMYDESKEGLRLFEEKIKELRSLYAEAGFLFNLDAIPIGKKLQMMEKVNPEGIYSFMLNGEVTQDQKEKIKHVLRATLTESTYPGNFNANLEAQTADEVIKSLKGLQAKIQEICTELYTETVSPNIIKRIGFTLNNPNLVLQGGGINRIREYLKTSGFGEEAFLDPLIESPFHRVIH